MTALEIVLILLALAGVWALVELALTNRKSRVVVSELAENVNNTLNEVNPVIAKVDGILDEVQPAIKQVDPLLISAISAVDSLSKDLDSVDVILGDMSRTTTGIANASDAVVSSVNNTVNAASGFVSNMLNKSGSKRDERRLSAADKAPAALQDATASAEANEPLSSSDDGYFSYPAASEQPKTAE